MVDFHGPDGGGGRSGALVGVLPILPFSGGCFRGPRKLRCTKGREAFVSQFQQDGQVRRAQPAHDADHVGVPDGNYRNQRSPEQEIADPGKRRERDRRAGALRAAEASDHPPQRHDVDD